MTVDAAQVSALVLSADINSRSEGSEEHAGVHDELGVQFPDSVSNVEKSVFVRDVWNIANVENRIQQTVRHLVAPPVSKTSERGHGSPTNVNERLQEFNAPALTNKFGCRSVISSNFETVERPIIGGKLLPSCVNPRDVSPFSSRKARVDLPRARAAHPDWRH